MDRHLCEPMDHEPMDRHLGQQEPMDRHLGVRARRGSPWLTTMPHACACPWLPGFLTVEAEQVIYREMQYDGLIPYQQAQQAMQQRNLDASGDPRG